MSSTVKGNINKIAHDTICDNNNWFNDIKENILYNDKVSKPKIVKLIFESTY
jgi:hypothetical protein